MMATEAQPEHSPLVEQSFSATCMKGLQPTAEAVGPNGNHATKTR